MTSVAEMKLSIVSEVHESAVMIVFRQSFACEAELKRWFFNHDEKKKENQDTRPDVCSAERIGA